jgi:hypothetical protein
VAVARSSKKETYTTTAKQNFITFPIQRSMDAMTTWLCLGLLLPMHKPAISVLPLECELYFGLIKFIRFTD